MNPTPTISIIIPTYNRADYLPETLDSVLSQGDGPWEVVVVDDGSTDETRQVLEGIVHDRLRTIFKPHSGAPETRNLGIKEAKGEYVLWLGSDDVLLPGTLNAYVQALRDMPDVDVFYGDLVIADATLTEIRPLAYEDWYERGEALLARTIHENPIPDGGSVVRKRLYDAFGDYDPFFRRAHDYEWWSRLVGKAQFKHLGQPVYKWRWHGGNMSSGTVTIDTSFDARVIRGLLDRYPLRRLFPDLDWDGVSSQAAEASAHLRLAQRFRRLGRVDESREYSLKAQQIASSANDPAVDQALVDAWWSLIEHREASILELESRLSEHIETVRHQDSLVSERDAYIKQLEQRVDTYAEGIRRQENLIQKRDQEIHQLKNRSWTRKLLGR